MFHLSPLKCLGLFSLMLIFAGCDSQSENNNELSISAKKPTLTLNNFDQANSSSNVSIQKSNNLLVKFDNSVQAESSTKDYESARSLFWKSLYHQGGETLYCGEKFGSGYNKGINIEHVFPMSWVTKSLHCGERKQCRRNSQRFNQIEADLHNLFPSLSDINYQRSSIAFGMVNGEKRDFGSCDFEISQRPRLVEPREKVRGDIARAMFYMVHQYDELMLFDKQVKTLKQWHRADPVSNEEKRRNDRIEKIQGNRNPFIDKPELINVNF